MRERERESEAVGEAGAGGSDGAKAGAGDPPKAEERQASEPKKSKSKGGGRPRGEAVLDDDMKRLVRVVGKDKLAPDVTSIEKHYSRSLRIRRLIAEFLIENEGTTWTDLPELHARAANFAGCSSLTAARWVYQFTRPGARHRLVEAVDHWILDVRQ